MNAPRGRSTVSSINSSRESSMLSKSFSVTYTTHMKAQSGYLNWANQTEDKLFNLLYQTSLEGGGVLNIYSQTNPLNNVPTLYIGYIHTIPPTVPAINSNISFLPYDMCQLGNPDLWNGCTNPISIFSQTMLQEININNIKISLHHISDFISK